MADTSTSPDRFKTPRSTLLIDQSMYWFITVGGVGIIVAVALIFLFIFMQIVPLLGSAAVTSATPQRLGAGNDASQVVSLGSDEWGDLPWILRKDGSVLMVPQDGRPPIVHQLAIPAPISSARIDNKTQTVMAGLENGSLVEISASFANKPDKDRRNQVTGDVTLGTPITIEGHTGRSVSVGAGGSSEEMLLATVLETDGKRKLIAAISTIARSGLGAEKGKVEIAGIVDLTSMVAGKIERILVDERGDSVVAVTEDGLIHYLYRNGTSFEVRQPPFQAFPESAKKHVSSLEYLLGDVSLVAVSDEGENRIFQLGIDPVAKKRIWRLTKELAPLGGAATAYANSARNKCFVLASGKTVSLRHSTLASVRWHGKMSAPVTRVALNGKFDRAFLLSDDGTFQRLDINDPHPEAGLTAYFGKVWYEGGDKPEYAWQSSGSTDDFEPKLSLIPLIFGTLKGTFYAMLFAIPIALLAALYCAEFMHSRFKVIVKPTVEIMASLPSVVLGFLAALWLAPLMETKVPSLLLVLLALPTMAMFLGWFWSGLPDHIKTRIRPGYEFIAFTPVMLLVGWVAWSLGPIFEQVCFQVPRGVDAKGVTIWEADFRAWWPYFTGASFEQRNSLVVGFIMGFAVIPILFTIIEDALSNVPQALRSGSLALGASRWQTATRVVLPTASAGILSAMMIGLGRAIGETMIVVMATGNTPVMDINIFNGMRTLSANIAVELPEAPHHSTLYRTLFLGAFLLFCLTFAINTLAEVLRTYLREKYKTV